MKNDNKPTAVALIFGGKGKEHDVSVLGAKFIIKNINRECFTVYPVLIDKTGKWFLCADDFTPKFEVYPTLSDCGGGLAYEGGFIPLGCAFPFLHGDMGEDGTVPGALETAGIKYVGSGVRAGAVASDKILTKIVAEHLGIPVAKWICARGEATDALISKVSDDAEKAFGYPMFIKPSRLGSSVGASVVRNKKEFFVSYKSAADLSDGAIIVEELVDIDFELECAYYGTKSKEIFTNLGKIKASSAFYDYESKYINGSADISTGGVRSDVSKEVQSYSRRLCNFLEIKNISRFDFFLTKSGKILFNEINTVPGFTESSLYPRLAAEAGVPTEELINSLLEDAAFS